MWTAHSPTHAQLKRLVLLAEESYTSVIQALFGTPAVARHHITAAFTPSVEDFHVHVRLCGERLPRVDGKAYGNSESLSVGEWLDASGVCGPHVASKKGSREGASMGALFLVPLTKDAKSKSLRGFNPLAQFVKVNNDRFPR